MRTALAAVALSLAVGSSVYAAPRAFGGEADVRTFLQDRFRALDIDDQDASFSAAFVDLNGDGRRDALVLVSGPGWCGTGGCQFYVLEHRGDRYRLKGRMPTTKAPISVLNHSTNGWRDIATFVSGGGIIRGYEEVVQYDGWKYPGVSSAHVARRNFRWPAGKVVIARDAPERALYPAPH